MEPQSLSISRARSVGEGVAQLSTDLFADVRPGRVEHVAFFLVEVV